MSKSALTHRQIADLTLRHLKAEGPDDIFRPPMLNEGIEFSEFASQRFLNNLHSRVVQFLQHPSDKSFSPVLRMAYPKGRHTYRHASLIEIEDLAKYTALVFKIATHIESARIAPDKQIVFSSRFSELVPCIENRTTYNKFRVRSGELSRQIGIGVKVTADISNFYDRLNLHRLESTLEDIGCDHACVRALNQILMHWANRNSYGLPVGCDASRILAEAMLINIDNRLYNEGVNFIRYVDDFRIFTATYADAHCALTLLTEALDREGLFINSEKTKILSASHELDEPGGPPIDFEMIDEGAKEVVRRVVSRGYKVKISTYYREPGKDAIKALQEVELATLLAEVSVEDVKEDRLRFFVKAFIYGKVHDVYLLVTFLRRHVHMMGYTVSALIKEHARIDGPMKTALSEAFLTLYDMLSGTDFHRLCVVRLLSSEPYFQPGMFTTWFSALKLTESPIFIRELVTFFCGKMTREEIRELVRYSHSSHPAVRRAIIKAALTSERCLHEEISAWARVWVNANDDAFTQAVCQDFLHPQAAEPYRL